MSNSQLHKLKSGIKNCSKVTLKLSSNVVGEYNRQYHHQLVLKFKNSLYKIGPSGGFLGRPLEPLLKTGLPLIGNVLKVLVKSVLIPLGSTAASATDAVIHKKMFGLSTTTLIFFNKDLNYNMKIIKSLEESGLLIKGVSETFKNEAKEKRSVFISMLLCTSGASSLGNMLTGKGRGVVRAGEGTITSGEGTIRAG